MKAEKERKKSKILFLSNLCRFKKIKSAAIKTGLKHPIFVSWTFLMTNRKDKGAVRKTAHQNSITVQIELILRDNPQRNWGDFAMFCIRLTVCKLLYK